MSNAIKLRVLSVAILSAALSGCYSEAATESRDHLGSVVRIRHEADQARGRVWLLARSGVVMVELKTPRPIRRVQLPGWIWAGEPFGCPPALAVGPKGEVVVSSDTVPTLWRVDPETFAVTRHDLTLDADTDKDIGFSRLEYSAGENAYVGVSGMHGSVWRIDPLLGRAQKVAQAAPSKADCRSGKALRYQAASSS